MKISRLILFLFFLASHAAIGQGSSTYVFKVLANKGANRVVKAGSDKKVFLRPGLTLFSSDEILATNGAYIGLMHRTGRTIEVRTAGTTKIVDLEAKIISSKKSVTSKYATFVLNKMKAGDGNVSTNYRYNMKATGAVERANSTAISAMLPTSVSVLNPEVIVRWNSVGAGAFYEITVKNIFDEELITAETDKTHLLINLDDENLAAEELIVLSIKVKDNPDLFSPEYGIERLSSEKAQTLSASLAELKSELSGDSPLDKLILASYFEENGLILDALTQYEEILEMSPDVEDFKMLYGEFLINHGLSQIESQ